MENKTTFEKGQEVTTKHGEKLTILEVKDIPVMRHGKATGETMIMLLAESGGHNTWFPVANLKTEGE